MRLVLVLRVREILTYYAVWKQVALRVIEENNILIHYRIFFVTQNL